MTVEMDLSAMNTIKPTSHTERELLIRMYACMRNKSKQTCEKMTV